MTRIIDNPYRGAAALPAGLVFDGGKTVTSAARVRDLLSHCPAHEPTPLHDALALAEDIGLAGLWIKDERTRMGLGSFKALGAAFVIARHAAETENGLTDPANALKGQTFVTASAGNHGLSLAAGARVFGARAVVYLAETVPAGFADLLRAKGAEVVVEGADYEASLAAASARAEAEGWTLLADGTWEGYPGGVEVMEGYTAMAAEIAEGMAPPTHIFLQAGVGGLAAGITGYLREVWGDAPLITVVEPEAAPALIGSIEAGTAQACSGPVSSMGRLDCKEPSLAALETLARDADRFMTISEEDAARGVETLAAAGFDTSASGGAGFAGLLAARDAERVGPAESALVILSEGPADD